MLKYIVSEPTSASWGLIRGRGTTSKGGKTMPNSFSINTVCFRAWMQNLNQKLFFIFCKASRCIWMLSVSYYWSRNALGFIRHTQETNKSFDNVPVSVPTPAVYFCMVPLCLSYIAAGKMEHLEEDKQWTSLQRPFDICNDCFEMFFETEDNQ